MFAPFPSSLPDAVQRWRTGSPRARQRGQSLVEFTVLALVLVPAFIALPLLGKYLDLAHATELAARYLVFESTVANPDLPPAGDEQRAAEVRRRFFSRADAPIKSGDAAGDFSAHRNPLWSDHHGRPLLQTFAADVSVDSQLRTRPAPASALLAGSAGFDLPQHNELSTRVVVRPRNIAGFVPLDEIGLEIARSQTILSNPWTAASSQDAAARIENAGPAAYPIAALKAIGDTVGSVLPPLLLDPALKVGRVDAEILPCDRLPPRC